MIVSLHGWLVAGALWVAVVGPAIAQRTPTPSALLLPQPFARNLPVAGPGLQPIVDFKDTDIKFSLQALMETLRDHQHEGWVLAVYPDPNTGHPLIGAGFSLDVPAVEHAQIDPLNPHVFVEPSSAQLWQAAGLSPERLQAILDQFARNQAAWSARTYHRKIVRHTLTPQLTEEEAMQLLRVSAIQAVVNARAYCRGFDRLSGPQQMALSQLVFQMGTNLEQFVQFLDTLNDYDNARELAQLDGYMQTYEGHWHLVQSTLMDSQWARRYSIRATTVIAMFDPEYGQSPVSAEQRVLAVLHPPVVHASAMPGSKVRRVSARARRGKARSQGRRKLT